MESKVAEMTIVVEFETCEGREEQCTKRAMSQAVTAVHRRA